MAIDTTPSQVATNALPCDNIVGDPLQDCIEAQTMAAKTSWNFIQEVGLNTDSNTGDKQTINVSFWFTKDGRIAQLNVPLQTIVPTLSLQGAVEEDNKIFLLPVIEGKVTSYAVGVSGKDKKVIVKAIDTYTDQKNREIARLDREVKDRQHQDKMIEEIEKKREENDKKTKEWNEKAWATSREEVKKMEDAENKNKPK